MREFTHPRISFEELPPHRPEGLEARLMALLQAGYLESGVTESVKIRRAEALAKGSVRWLPLKKLIAGAIAPSMLRPATRYDVIDRLVSHPHAEQLFDAHRPVAAGGLESRADPLGGAAAAHRQEARHPRPWRSIRAGTTSPTS